MTSVFTLEEFEHGLRCAECDSEFVEDQPISQRLDGIDADGNVWVTLVCGACAVEVVRA
jgi:hypothetical protein